MTLLRVEGLETAYGDSQVLFGLSLEVNKGEVVALLGRNGAGKTTTLSSIMGLVPPRKGAVYFKDQAIARLEPFQICRAGLGYVAEDCRLFTSLTVAENLETARMNARDGGAPWGLPQVLDLFPDIRNFLNRKAGALSGGQQRMVAIARTLMGKSLRLQLSGVSITVMPADLIVSIAAFGPVEASIKTRSGFSAMTFSGST